jgi:hypothetical protein
MVVSLLSDAVLDQLRKTRRLSAGFFMAGRQFRVFAKQCVSNG